MADTLDKGYGDTKEFICTGCGKTITLTKFASQKTCKCDECKAHGTPTNPEIVAKALDSKPILSHGHTISSTPLGETKDCPCIKCGKMVTVTKFASAKKVLCDECKGLGVKAADVDYDDDDDTSVQRRLEIDPSKIQWDKLKSLEEYRINEIVIANKNLQKVTCPACGHQHMKVLRLLDSTQFGIIASYQCPKCLLFGTLSEQTHHLIKPMKSGGGYNYNGEQMQKIGSTLDDTRASNSIRILLNICKEHNIPLDGYELPPYFYKEDKPVPVGFVIPPEDRFQKVISDVIDGLTKATRQGNTTDEPEDTRYITLSDTLANQIIHDLGKLLKED